MKALTYFSNVKDGNLQDNVRKKIASELSQFNGKRVEVTIKPLKSTRSLQQNRLWWLYMGILSKDIGYTKDEMHAICKMKFLKREKVVEETSEILPYLKSTTELSRGEFADMVNELIRWSAETFNIVLPLPESQLDINL